MDYGDAESGSFGSRDSFDKPAADDKSQKPREPEGVTVFTVAGADERGHHDGPAMEARFNSLSGLTGMPDGSLIVSDAYCIKRIFGGSVKTLAGSDVYGFRDARRGDTALFDTPCGVVYDAKTGRLIVADRENNRLRAVTTSGAVYTVAGSGELGDADGLGKEATFASPFGLAAGVGGQIFVSDFYGARIRVLKPPEGEKERYGHVVTLAGKPPREPRRPNSFGVPGYRDGHAHDAQFYCPAGMAVGPNGDVYVADSMNHRVRRIDHRHADVSTVVGHIDPPCAYCTGLTHRSHDCYETPAWTRGDLSRLYEFMTELTSRTEDGAPIKLSKHQIHDEVERGLLSDLEIPRPVHHVRHKWATRRKWRKLPKFDDEPGTPVTFVTVKDDPKVIHGPPHHFPFTAPGEKGGDKKDGTLIEALLNTPTDVAFSQDGTLYVADTGNNCIRQIDLSTSMIYTLVGNGKCESVDGIGESVSFRSPRALHLDETNHCLYVADAFSVRVVKLPPSTEASVNDVE